jgi:DNA-binding MarR family transcriptional regulator
MPPQLAPTVWRTCRVIACGTRLRLLQRIAADGPACVTALARRCRLSRFVATQSLRALQARGLLRATRTSRWVVYDLQTDPAVRHAADVQQAVLAAFRRGETHADIRRAATAFTHERRLLLVRALAAGPSTAPALARRCAMSPNALYRHAAKLERRGLLRRSDGDTLRLTSPAGGIVRDLLRIALRD